MNEQLNMRRVGLRALNLLAAATLLWHCGGPRAEKKAEKAEAAKEKKEEAIPVEVEPVVLGRIESVIQASTNLEAEEQVQVFARTTNLLAELYVEEGDLVERDQVLARLEDDTQEILVDKAEIRLERAQKDYNRKKDLYEKELITQQEYNDSDFELKQAQLELAEARQELDYTEIRAPIEGTVSKRLVKLGDQVNVNQRLFDLVDFKSMIAPVFLPERNLARLALGQKARITAQALGGSTHEGFVQRISPTVDAGTGTIEVTIKVAEIGRLRPGMFVNVNLVLAVHEQAPLIPKRALVYDSDQLYIFRVNAENRVQRLLIEPVLMDKDNVEPGPEIALGDRIVVAGQTGLKDGALVAPLAAEASPAEPEPAESPATETDLAAAGVGEQ